MAKSTIGTAWIQVKPTTDSIRGAVEKGLNGTQIGATVGANFSAGFAGAVAGITSQLTQQITSIVSSNWSDAMNRADVLTRFPKVMELMGFEANEASETIEKLRSGVSGLPTSLASAVSGTQRLANTTGDLDKASDWMLAISDGMLITANTAYDAERATEQFVQAIQRGKPMGNDWNTVMEVASPIMNRLAQSLGYTSAAIGGDFYTAWQNGTLAVEDLMDAFVKLDKEGSDSMVALNQLSRQAVGGYQTSLKIINQTISNIGASFLKGDYDAIDGYLKSLTEQVTATAPKLATAFAQTGLAVAKILPDIIPPLVDAIVATAPEFINAIAEIIVKIAENLPKLIQVILDNLPVIVDAIGTSLATLFGSEAFMKSLPIIAAIVFGPKVLAILGGGLKHLLGNLFSKKTVGSSVSTNLGKMVENIASTLGNSIKNLVTPLSKTLGTAIKEISKGLAGALKAFANPEILLGAGILAAAILAIGKAIEWATPGIKTLVYDVILPIANFIKDTLLSLIDAMTTGIIKLTEGAIIPLGEFLAKTFFTYIQTITDAMIRLTNEAVIPLTTVLAGTFTQVIQTIANLITGTLYVALDGLRGIIEAIGDGFLKMGQAIRTALEGVRGILQTFADLIAGIAESIVAIVALATHQSVSYGRGFAYVTAAATGGYVDGIGTSTSDSNLYALSKGEYVIRAAAARRIGYENLDSLNQTGTLASGNNFNFTINGYNKSPEELANIVSRKIALKTQGVMA